MMQPGFMMAMVRFLRMSGCGPYAENVHDMDLVETNIKETESILICAMDLPLDKSLGITAYLSNGGTLENARAIAAHESSQTTRLYDRTNDEVTLNEIERIII